MSKNDLDQNTLRILLEKGLLNKEDVEKLNQETIENDSEFYIKKTFNQFVMHLKNEYTQNTKSGYKTNVEKFLQYIFCAENIKDIKDDVKLPQFSKDDIERFFTHLIINEYSPASIRRFKNSLLQYFNYLSKLGYDGPQIRDIEIPKNTASKIDALRDEEIRGIAEYSDTLRNKLLILFMYETGMRRQELIDCKKEYIDFENKTVKIFNDGNFDRIGYFSDFVKELLVQYIDEWEKKVEEINNKRMKRVKAKGGTYYELKISEYLFQTPRSSQISYSTIYKALKDTAFEYYLNKLANKELNIEEAKKIAEEKVSSINTETLRHSKRACLFSIGKSVEEVQTLMGDENKWVVKRYLKMAQKLYPEKFRDLY